MEFTKQYYDSIWGSVHRHDYCEYWATRIISTVGSGSRVLDAGTGCGFLVKTLCERGMDAWGLDTSDYAIANSCAPGRVLKASVTDIPFSDDYFDLVFSNGLWEYLRIEEIVKGRNEIWRVGKHQLHNIDHDKCDYRDDFVTWKQQEWWDEQLSAPKILVSCPTHEVKEYSHATWVDAVKAIDYPNFEIFVVDNSPTRECCSRWKDKVPMVWLGDYCNYSNEPTGDGHAERMEKSMKLVREKFLNEKFDRWFNVEIDVIIEPDMLKTLIRYGKQCDWIAHTYPARGEDILCCSGVGCSLWSRRLIEDFSFDGSGSQDGFGVDASFWNWFLAQKKYTCVEYWGCSHIKHLRSPNG